MAGVPASLPAGVRLSDHISLGVIARAVPPGRVRQVLAETGKAGERERDLPAQVDRKSTRLNSSHANISYAVFCSKKKTAPLAFRGERRPPRRHHIHLSRR